MNAEQFEFLKQITQCYGPSGAEGQVRDLIKERVEKFSTSITVDALGNLIITKGNGGNLVISAHMDEVALTVTGFEEDGTLRFSQVGGITPTHLPSKRVFFPEQNVFGVIGSKPVHLTKSQSGTVEYADLYIDIGTGAAKESRDLLQLGDLAVFDTQTKRLDAPNPSICGKAIDDRLGCYLLCNMICNEKIDNCTFLFSVQEEVGCIGAATFAAAHPFDYGIALDVTTPNDLPKIQGPNRVCQLGKGPVISFADGRCVYDSHLISGIFNLLERNHIPCQTKSKRTGGNEASAFLNEGVGASAISVSTPCRYIHGPVGVVWEEDIDHTEKALLLIIEEIQRGGFDRG